MMGFVPNCYKLHITRDQIKDPKWPDVQQTGVQINYGVMVLWDFAEFFRTRQKAFDNGILVSFPVIRYMKKV